MTPLEFAKLLDYIKYNNGWGENMYENQVIRHRRCFKYVNSNFDTRDGRIWHIEFLEYGGSEPRPFRIENKSDIIKIYEYLNETVQFNVEECE